MIYLTREMLLTYTTPGENIRNAYTLTRISILPYVIGAQIGILGYG